MTSLYLPMTSYTFLLISSKECFSSCFLCNASATIILLLLLLFSFVFLRCTLWQIRDIYFDRNKCNVGYGFVNMTSPEATLRFYKAFQQQRWEVFNSRKICHLTYARVQVSTTLLYLSISSILLYDEKIKIYLFIYI